MSALSLAADEEALEGPSKGGPNGLDPLGVANLTRDSAADLRETLKRAGLGIPQLAPRLRLRFLFAKTLQSRSSGIKLTVKSLHEPFVALGG